MGDSMTQAKAIPKWSTSNAGNPTMVISGRRLTIFHRGSGWRYAVAVVGQEGAASYSRTFKTVEAAKKAGLKTFGVGPGH